jgi:SAM-dependent methyltransferase
MGLVDDVFGCAPGRWDLSACETCGAAWLDPRPTPGSILRAYDRYYTHEAGPPVETKGGVKAALRNGYLRARWGYEVSPAWSIGELVVGRRRAAALDLSVRHLPRPHGRARLLDVGCGNGAFLLRMRGLGWEPHGLEPDRKAAAAAAAAGIDVEVGTLADAAWPYGTFDAVTLSSVIEHLHDPRAALAAVHRWLAPGGTIHVVTPNLRALGHARFGAHWRGLEAPRHLVLFDRGSLTRLLTEAGFETVRFAPQFAGEWFWLASGAIERGAFPDDGAALPAATRRALAREGRQADRRVAFEPALAEELVAIASMPRVAR